MASKAPEGEASPVAAVVAAASAATICDLSPDIQEKYDRVRSVGEECVSESELKALLVKKVGEMGSTFNLYDGFEPSGRVHIAQGAFKANNVNKCTSSGGVFIFWVADWYVARALHAQSNAVRTLFFCDIRLSLPFSSFLYLLHFPVVPRPALPPQPHNSPILPTTQVRVNERQNGR
jgi:hypothetical protein